MSAAAKAEVIEKVQSSSLPVSKVLIELGVSRSTYYRWRKDDPDFAEKCDEVIELSVGRINDLAESQLINAIKNQNMSAITFWLRHHHRSYRNRMEVDARINTIQQACRYDGTN